MNCSEVLRALKPSGSRLLMVRLADIYAGDLQGSGSGRGGSKDDRPMIKFLFSFVYLYW